jgi:hypothetical protein
MLRPPKHFEELSRRHFWLKRREIAAQCVAWQQAAEACARDQASAKRPPGHNPLLGNGWADQYGVFGSGSGLNGNMRAIATQTKTVCSQIQQQLLRLRVPDGMS